MLEDADPDRAVEIIEDLARKMAGSERDYGESSHGHSRSSGGHHRSYPSRSSFDRLARRFGHLLDDLDDGVLSRLREADPGRAEEILEDIDAKGEPLRNPNGFVVKALRDFPHRRGPPEDRPRSRSPPPSREQRRRGGDYLPPPPPPRDDRDRGRPSEWSMRSGLRQDDPLIAGLDDQARRLVDTSDPLRVEEVLAELADKGSEVRNPSGFVSKALMQHPHPRGPAAPPSEARGPPRPRGGGDHRDHHRSGEPPRGEKRPRPGDSGWEPGSYDDNPLTDLLDTQARRLLETSNPLRVQEVLAELADKEGEVRNPSGFVSKALLQYPEPRGREESSALRARTSDWCTIYGLHPDDPLIRGLDDQARRQMEAANPMRVEEVLEELKEKGGSVRNPSGFISKALSQYPNPRGPEDPSTKQEREEKRSRGSRWNEGTRFGLDPDDPQLRGLDDHARRQLEQADPERVQEVLDELSEKGDSVRNPSGFVSKALTQYPYPRGRKS